MNKVQKMTKPLAAWLCVLTLALLGVTGGLLIAHAGSVDEQECDAVFYKALDYALEEEAVTVQTVEIEKQPLYDIELTHLGYVYDMTIGDRNGFGLVICTDGGYDVTELYLDSTSPYRAYDGINVYINVFLYAVYADSQYIETSSGAVLDQASLDLLAQNAFYSASDAVTYETETIYYTNRTTDKYNIVYRHPAYTPVNMPSNSCTPTAGANIIGYYTRFFPQLVPGFTPGNTFANFYLYYEFAEEIDPVIQTLYDYMGTNQSGDGTTINGFKTGMTRFCQEKGLNISYASTMNNGRFNYEVAKQNFRVSGLPAVIFVDTFTVTDMSPHQSDDYLSLMVSSQCHAMACFGYQQISYTLTNGSNRTDTYLAVATGLHSISKGYFNINYKTQIDEMYSIRIY